VIAQVTKLSIATVNRQVTAPLDAGILRERADLAVSGGDRPAPRARRGQPRAVPRPGHTYRCAHHEHRGHRLARPDPRRRRLPTRDIRVTAFGNRVQEAGAGVVSLGGLYADPIGALRRAHNRRPDVSA
jgi:hypothetical protein